MPQSLDQLCKNVITDYQSGDRNAAYFAAIRATNIARQGFHRHEVAARLAIPGMLASSLNYLSSNDRELISTANVMLDFLIQNAQIGAVARYPLLTDKILEAANLAAPDQERHLATTHYRLTKYLRFGDTNEVFVPTVAIMMPESERPIYSAEQRFRRAIARMWMDLPKTNPELRNPNYGPEDFLRAIRNARTALPFVKSEIVVPLTKGVASKDALSRLQETDLDNIHAYLDAKMVAAIIFRAMQGAVDRERKASLIDVVDGIKRESFPHGTAVIIGRGGQIVRDGLHDRGEECGWYDIPGSPTASYLVDELGLAEVRSTAFMIDSRLKNGTDDYAGILEDMGKRYPTPMDHIYRVTMDVTTQRRAKAHQAERTAGNYEVGLGVLRSQLRGVEHNRLH